MHDKEKFDDIIRGLLEEEANKIEPRKEIIGDVGDKIKGMKQASRLKSAAKNVFPMKLNIRGYMAAALMLFVIAPGLTLMFSKEARVAAAHGIDAVKSWIYVMNKTEDGYKPVKVEVNNDVGEIDMAYDYTGMTDEELTREAGFNIHIPAELFGGYKCFQKNKGVRKSDNATVRLTAIYYNKNNTIALNVSKDNYIQYLENKKTIDIKDTKFYWAEGNVNGIYPNHDMQQKPVGIKIIHILAWEYEGAFYELYGNDEDITYDIAQKMAEHFINNITKTYDINNDAGVIRSQSYLPKNTTKAEIENMLGFKVKIPESVPGSFNITLKMVGMDPMNKSCNMFQGEYDNGDKTLNLIITEGNWPVMEYDRIRDVKDDSRIVVVEGIECHWSYSDDVHFLGWMDNGVYYCISYDRGDFKSIDEAVAIAKSIIKS